MSHTSKSHKSKKDSGMPGATTALTKAPPPDKPSETFDQPLSMPDTGVPAEKRAEDQPWYRPPDSKSRGKCNTIAILTAAGHDDATIAKKLKITEKSVRTLRWIGKKNGWTTEDDEVVDVEAEFAHSIDRKIVRNISASLDGQMMNHQQFDMTLAAAKGRGHFKNHTDTKAETVNGMQVVAIQVVMPPIGAGDQTRVEISDADVGGTPAYLEGEVADGVEAPPAGDRQTA